MKRELFSLQETKSIIKKYNEEDIKLRGHYLKYLNKGKREINKETIKEFLFGKEFYFVEKQINGWIRYKIVFELSRKYDLVIVVKEDKPKILKVITAYKTNKKIKEKWKKSLKLLMRK